MYKKYIKRLLDIIISLVLIVITFPILIIVIPLNIIFLGLPIHNVIQERIGQNIKLKRRLIIVFCSFSVIIKLKICLREDDFMYRQEHPNPQFLRDNWLNLNGEWDFEFDFGASGMDRKLFEQDSFSKKIALLSQQAIAME